jgi:hypothetical protein
MVVYLKDVADRLSSGGEGTQYVSWNTTASRVAAAALGSLASGGGTDPTQFLPLLRAEAALVLGTDGEVHGDLVDRFRTGVLAKAAEWRNKVAICIIFAKPKDGMVHCTTLQDVANRNVNFSVFDGILRQCNNCLVLLAGVFGKTTASGQPMGRDIRVLDAKGVFASLVSCAGLPALSTVWSDLPSFQDGVLDSIGSSRAFVFVPDGHILLNDAAVDVWALVTPVAEGGLNLTTSLVAALSNRLVLASLNDGNRSIHALQRKVNAMVREYKKSDVAAALRARVLAARAAFVLHAQAGSVVECSDDGAVAVVSGGAGAHAGAPARSTLVAATRVDCDGRPSNALLHEALCELKEALKAEKAFAEATEVEDCTALRDLQGMIAAYLADETGLVLLGCNRARAAVKLSAKDLTLPPACEGVPPFECPFMFEPGHRGVFVRAMVAEDIKQHGSRTRGSPGVVDTSGSASATGSATGSGTGSATGSGTASAELEDISDPVAVEYFTQNWACEAPFMAGWEASALVLPGIFSDVLASVSLDSSIRRHPYTNAPIVGFLPVTHHPSAALAHMSKLWGASRKLLHFLRMYVVVMCRVAQMEWCGEEDRQAICASLQCLCAEYKVVRTLKGAVPGDPYVPLADAVHFALSKPTDCLVGRPTLDVEAMIVILRVLRPTVVDAVPLGVVRVLCQTLDAVAEVQVAVKESPKNLWTFAVTLDEENGLVVACAVTVRGLVAQIAWTSDTHLKIMGSSSTPWAMVDAWLRTRVGHADVLNLLALLHAHMAQGVPLQDVVLPGGRPPTAVMDLRKGIPEPSGPHFPDEARLDHRERCGAEDSGRGWRFAKPRKCFGCGIVFDSSQKLFAHLRSADGMGWDFYNGVRFMQRALEQSGPGTPNRVVLRRFMVLFMNAAKHPDGARCVFTKRFGVRAHQVLAALRASSSSASASSCE